MIWLDLKAASKYLGLSKETMYRLIDRKQIPFYRIGKLYRFDTESLDKWILGGESENVHGKLPKVRKIQR